MHCNDSQVGSLILLRVGAVVCSQCPPLPRSCPAIRVVCPAAVPPPARYRTTIIRFSERAEGRNGCCAAEDGVWGAGKVAVMIAARLARLVLSAGMFGFGSARTEHTPCQGSGTTHNRQPRTNKQLYAGIQE